MRLSLVILTLLASGCGSVGSLEASCRGTADARSAHAAALVADGGPLSLVTGANLIAQIDAACK